MRGHAGENARARLHAPWRPLGAQGRPENTSSADARARGRKCAGAGVQTGRRPGGPAERGKREKREKKEEREREKREKKREEREKRERREGEYANMSHSDESDSESAPGYI